MNFVERFINVFVNGAFKAYVGLGELPEHVRSRYKQYGEFSPMDDLQSRSLLFLSTTDPVLDYATPSMPNLIHVGGLSVKPTQARRFQMKSNSRQ